jgi:hypothetical protein
MFSHPFTYLFCSLIWLASDSETSNFVASCIFETTAQGMASQPLLLLLNARATASPMTCNAQLAPTARASLAEDFPTSMTATYLGTEEP